MQTALITTRRPLINHWYNIFLDDKLLAFFFSLCILGVVLTRLGAASFYSRRKRRKIVADVEVSPHF